MNRLLPSFLACLFCGSLLLPSAKAVPGANLVPNASMDNVVYAPSFWQGIDLDKVLIGITQAYMTVTDKGSFTDQTLFPAAIDAGDMLGRGVLDLMMVDSAGYVRYFPNSGTAQNPQFTSGIVLPLRIPRGPYSIQLSDLYGTGRPDLILGDSLGHLYVLKNLGGKEVPQFDNPKNMEDVEIDVRDKGDLWCNYLSPAFVAWNRDSRDLIIGDGTYAANNIYYMRNKGSTAHPVFDSPVVLIPGKGRRYITVRAYDWFHSGRPDLIVSDWAGDVALYRNDSSPASADGPPHFKAPQIFRLGNKAQFVPGGHLTVADLYGDGKLALIWADTQGKVSIARNTGTLEAPRFDKADFLKGSDTPLRYAVPKGWELGNMETSNAAPHWPMRLTGNGFFFMAHLVGSDPADPVTFEPNFALPDDSSSKHALKFEFLAPPPQILVPYPLQEQDSFTLSYLQAVSLEPKKNYVISCKMKGSGFSKLDFIMNTSLYMVKRDTTYKRDYKRDDFKSAGLTKSIELTADWSTLEFPFSFDMDKDLMNKESASFTFAFYFKGQGSFYLTDFAITER